MRVCNRKSALSERRRGEGINTLSLGLTQAAAARGLTPNLCADPGFSVVPRSPGFLGMWEKEP